MRKQTWGLRMRPGTQDLLSLPPSSSSVFPVSNDAVFRASSRQRLTSQDPAPGDRSRNRSSLILGDSGLTQWSASLSPGPVARPLTCACVYWEQTPPFVPRCPASRVPGPPVKPFLRRARGNSPFPLVSRGHPNGVISEAPPNASQFSTALLSAGFQAPRIKRTQRN